MKHLYWFFIFIGLSFSAVSQKNYTNLQKQFDQFFGQHQLDSAKSMLDKMAATKMTSTELALYWNNKGCYYNQTLLLDSSIFYLTKVLSSKAANTTKHRATMYLAKSYLKSGQFEKSINLYKKAVQYSLLLDTTAKIISLTALSSVYADEDNLDSAKVYMQHLSSYIDTSNYTRHLASYYDVNSVIQFRESNYTECIVYVKKASDVYKKIGDTKGEASCIAKIGALMVMLNQYPQALEYFQMALIIADKNNYPQLYLDIQYNMASTYYAMGEYSKALKSFYILEPHLKAKNIINDLIDNHISIASCQINLGQTDQALIHLENASLLAKEAKIDRRLALEWYTLGTYYMQVKRYKKATAVFYEALNAEKNDLDLISKIHQQLSASHQQLGDYKTALNHLSQHKLWSDSILNETSLKNIHEIKTRYEVEIKDQENKNLNAELAYSEVLASKNNRIKNTLFVLVALLCLGFIVLVLLFRLRIKNKQQALTIKGQENKLLQFRLVQFTQGIIEKNKLISTLNNELSAVKDSEAFSTQLLKKISTQTDWKKFTSEFNLVYPSFIEKFTSKHNTVTTNEVRIACLVKLQLSDKEIADVLSIEYDSVKKSKSRFKKKLGMDKNISLQDYFNSIN